MCENPIIKDQLHICALVKLPAIVLSLAADLHQGGLVVVIIIHHIGRGGHLCHQELYLAIAIHDKETSIPLLHLGYEEDAGATTFEPAAPGLAPKV